ncbi:hypothetical protein QFC19_000150 [Naganishia cerealis]|uniref:Uncharacterized protein n=1 Tax=Naganishia cerealis TaxID=610337 RepID=A0ACC2WS16_9TREE|nr:hypothetical protein QFC19_000150 [Naganishia cerealis]
MTDSATTNVTIQLSPEEARFCDLLDEFAKEGRKKIKSPDVEVEIPELLGLPSSDLDITLSTCAGYPFAVAFTRYLTTLPLDPPISIRSIGKVNANPDQSKHLETATTSIMGLECDFVQLRSEVYADGSRIPSEIYRTGFLLSHFLDCIDLQSIGTPEEDALRRDITINTLFYNVHTRRIEDHTRLGLSDMANKLVRTPLDPLQTFRDDPLRVLRCVRFASRFGYELVDELKEAVKNEEILFTKADTPSKEPETTAALTASEGLNGTASVSVAKVQAKHLWLACALVPCRGGVVKEKKKEVSLMEAVIREGLKLGNADVGAVTRFFAASSRLSSPQHEGIEESIIRSKLDFGVLEVIDRYNSFVNRVEELGLPAAIQEKPRLDGNEINALLKLKPSILTKVLLQEVVTWQFDHPQSTREDCQEWLLHRQREGQLPTVEEPVKHKKGQNSGGKGGKNEEEKRKKMKKA